MEPITNVDHLDLILDNANQGIVKYDRIHKLQVGIISPSKLRKKLMGQRSLNQEEQTSNSYLSTKFQD
ncbi:hypothetical protein Lser_V15G00676 [Lactuca serriola]